MKTVVSLILLLLLAAGCAPEKSAARMEAEVLYNEGLQLILYKQPYDESEQSIGKQVNELFQQAIAKDSTYALPYAHLVWTYATMWGSEMPWEEADSVARWAAGKAMALDADLSMAHVAKGLVQEFWDKNLEQAEASFKRACELDPSNSEAHKEYAWLLDRTGRYAEALVEAKRASEADPKSIEAHYVFFYIYRHLGLYDNAIETYKTIAGLNPQYPWSYTEAAFTYIMLKEYDKAEAVAREGLQIDSTINGIKNHLAWALGKKGELEKALAIYQETGFKAAAGWILGLMNKEEQALAVVEELKTGEQKDEWWTAWNISFIYQTLGQKEEALNWLEEAGNKVKEQSPLQENDFGWRLSVDSEYDDLRSNERFQTIVAKTGYKK
jgi:tetratricopeptide (TPR) repeat protein